MAEAAVEQAALGVRHLEDARRQVTEARELAVKCDLQGALEKVNAVDFPDVTLMAFGRE